MKSLSPVAFGNRQWTMDERYQQNMAKEPELIGVTKTQMGKNIDAEMQKTSTAMTELFKEFPTYGKQLKAAWESGFNSPDIVQLPKALRDKLNRVTQNLRAAIPNSIKTVETPDVKDSKNADGAAAGATKAPKIEGDRLAKIGLFIGSGGPSLDYARRTAENTQQMVRAIRDLKSSGRIPATADAVWG